MPKITPPQTKKVSMRSQQSSKGFKTPPPKISVIVPFYNAAKYLDACLASLESQTFPDFEIILIDDGSTDHSMAICKRHQRQHHALHNHHVIRIYHQSNQGVSAARNLGIQKAKGKYLMFVDADDYAEPTFLTAMYNCITQNHVDAVRCQLIIHQKDQSQCPESLLGLNGKYHVQIPYLLHYFFATKNAIACYSPALIIQKDYITSFDTDLNFMEDTVFYIKLLQQIHTIYFLNLPLYHYRYNTESATKNHQLNLPNIFRIVKASNRAKSYLTHSTSPALKSSDLALIDNNAFYNMIDRLLRYQTKLPDFLPFIQKLHHRKAIQELFQAIDYRQLNLNKKLLYLEFKHHHYHLLYYSLRFLHLLKRGKYV